MIDARGHATKCAPYAMWCCIADGFSSSPLHYIVRLVTVSSGILSTLAKRH